MEIDMAIVYATVYAKIRKSNVSDVRRWFTGKLTFSQHKQFRYNVYYV